MHRKLPIDIALAPVAAGIDLNLQSFRDKRPAEVAHELELQLNQEPLADPGDHRAEQVLRAALRDVELHGWEGSITAGGARLHLYGGSVTLHLGLGASVTTYIEEGSQTR
jgi:hypothetical protein